MIAQRMRVFSTSLFEGLQEKKREWENRTGKRALDLSIGSPDLSPDPSIMETLISAAKEPKNYRYAIQELPELKNEIASWYQRRYDVNLKEDEIVCLQGSQEALVNLPLALCDPGDVVFVCDPYYPIFSHAFEFAQADVHYLPMKEENDFLIDLDAIDEDLAKKAKMMIVSYPNNPTGAMANDAFYEKLVAFAKQYEILVLHDNAYSELVFDGRIGKSFLSYEGAKDIGIEINSFSKTYGMAGARLGVLVGKKEVLAVYRQLKANLDYGIFLPVQYAGIAALKEGKNALIHTRETFQHRRDLLVDTFKEAGWNIRKSQGSMFVWARIPECYADSEIFAQELLEQTGIVVTPGTYFGSMGKKYVRMALVVTDSVILEAAERLKNTNLFS